jgi:hypothetical protein
MGGGRLRGIASLVRIRLASRAMARHLSVRVEDSRVDYLCGLRPVFGHFLGNISKMKLGV